MVNLTDIINTLVTASHIIFDQGVVDAYGHISQRNPNNASTFFMSRDLPPALVTYASDIVEYNVADASPVNAHAPMGFLERDIHAGLYNQYSGINCVIHSHSPDVVPYTVSGVPFNPIHPLAGFIPFDTPNWDIEPLYNNTDLSFSQDFLVKSTHLGAQFSSYFSHPPSLTPKPLPDNPVVLMRNHGFATVSDTIMGTVVQAVYTTINARMLTTALDTHHAYGVKKQNGVHYITSQEQNNVTKGSDRVTVDRPFSLYVRQVEVNPLYRNLVNGSGTS